MAIKRFPDDTQGDVEERIFGLLGEWVPDYFVLFHVTTWPRTSGDDPILIVTVNRHGATHPNPILQVALLPKTREARIYPADHDVDYSNEPSIAFQLPYEMGKALVLGVISLATSAGRCLDRLATIDDELNRLDVDVFRQAEMFLAASGVEDGADFLSTLHSIAGDEHPDFGPPIPPGFFEDNDMTKPLQNFEIDACASAAHEVNRIFAALLGDHSHVPWENAPEWQKRAARSGVIAIAQGESTPEQSHIRWMDEKIASGWAYGAVKNEATKEHPCLVPYAELPPEQRIKDELFVTTVKSMMDALWRVPQG